jgi:hypothetical protein
VLEASDLTPAERALCRVAAAGGLLDRRTRRMGEDDPAQGRAWGKDRQIRAQLLRQLLTGQGCLDQTFGPPLSVRLRGAQITGRLNLGGLTLRCPLELYDCYLGGRLDLAKAKAPDVSLRGTYLGQRLSARQLLLNHNLNLSGGFHCHGPVKLRGAHIGGQLICDGATFIYPDGEAFSAEQLTVDGSLFMRGTQVTGQVRLLGAHIAGQLNCTKAKFTNPDGMVLTADGLTVDRDLFLHGAQMTGEVRLLGAHIGGQLVCEGGTFTNRDSKAFSADGLTVERGLLLLGVEVTGEVRLPSARIGGQLSCEEGTFTSPDGEAFFAERLTVDGHLILRGVQVTGQVRLPGAHIGGLFACEGETFTNPDGTVALDLQHASIAEAVFMRPAPAGLEGQRLNLTHARVGAWYDDKLNWPAVLYLEGFVYEALDAPNVSPRDRLDWISRYKDADGRTIYVPQPYEQLATVYRQAGDHEGARTVAIAKQQARRAAVSGWRRWPSQAWSGFLRWTIGYGYQPTLALPWLVGLFTLGWWVFDHAYPTQLRPAKSGLEQPGFNPARYTLDLLLPVANLKQRDAFVPHGYAAWWAFGLSLAGWLLAAVVVAGLSGVFKRD